MDTRLENRRNRLSNGKDDESTAVHVSKIRQQNEELKHCLM